MDGCTKLTLTAVKVSQRTQIAQSQIFKIENAHVTKKMSKI